jgi:putative redox protein
MSKMKSRYLGELRTEAVHLESSSLIQTDAPKDNQGLGEAFSPTDLLCTSLAACKLTIMGIKAKSLNIDLKGLEIEIEKKMSQSPRRIEEIILTFKWNGIDSSLSQTQMDSLKRSALACPVALSLDPAIKKTIIW